jgi:hypothetical protein
VVCNAAAAGKGAHSKLEKLIHRLERQKRTFLTGGFPTADIGAIAANLPFVRIL